MLVLQNSTISSSTTYMPESWFLNFLCLLILLIKKGNLSTFTMWWYCDKIHSWMHIKQKPLIPPHFVGNVQVRKVYPIRYDCTVESAVISQVKLDGVVFCCSKFRIEHSSYLREGWSRFWYHRHKLEVSSMDFSGTDSPSGLRL